MFARKTTAIATAIAMVLTGFGCQQAPQTQLGVDKPDAPATPPQEVETNTDYYPDAGTPRGIQTSADGRWQTFFYADPDTEYNMMVVRGPETELRIARAFPHAFSPDSRFLLYTAKPDGYAQALFVLVLTVPPQQRQLTNVGLKYSYGPLPPAMVPVPIDQAIDWFDGCIEYTVPGRGGVAINLKTGVVRDACK